ncbi:CDP-alcohol phosphatidyltransferase [Oceanibaculum indicum P24]|uniref:CDP-diacylglycerol--glycerol-3-phosphate 3-phosphatidyltransferase n=1 Tax=Oceanibaculum indicum P24 TaxID=1207063 RepID=K2JBD6_9PROT|nr:CDP-alcohol phosphatidyltransferase [Oceanibaculum indicum P24]
MEARPVSFLYVLPNLISLARIGIVPVVIWALLDGSGDLALWLFLLAGVSDAVDGYLARRFNARTEFGGYIDPIADKALLMSVYVTLGYLGSLPNWLVILVVFRDMLIVGGVILLQTMGYKVAMAPLLISKANTVAQVGLVLAVLGGKALAQPDYPWIAGWSVEVMTVLVACTTLFSGAAYVWIWGSRAMVGERQ